MCALIYATFLQQTKWFNTTLRCIIKFYKHLKNSFVIWIWAAAIWTNFVDQAEGFRPILPSRKPANNGKKMFGRNFFFNNFWKDFKKEQKLPWRHEKEKNYTKFFGGWGGKGNLIWIKKFRDGEHLRRFFKKNFRKF